MQPEYMKMKIVKMMLPAGVRLTELLDDKTMVIKWETDVTLIFW